MQPVDAGAVEMADDFVGALRLDQQGLAERASGHQIEALLGGDEPAARHFAQARRGGAVDRLGQHCRDLHLAQIGEAAGGGGAVELGEGAGRVVRLEIFVRDIVVVEVHDPPDLGAQHRAVGGIGRRVLFEEFQDVAGPGDAVRRGIIPGGEQHGVAHRLLLAPARQHVVADIGDAFRAERAGAHIEDGGAHGGGHPAVDAVADDVVEDAVGGADIGDALMAQLDVLQAEGRDARLAGGDLQGRQIDRCEARFGKSGGERNDVAAGGRAELKHPRGRKRRGGEPENLRHRRHARGVGLRKGF